MQAKWISKNPQELKQNSNSNYHSSDKNNKNKHSNVKYLPLFSALSAISVRSVANNIIEISKHLNTYYASTILYSITTTKEENKITFFSLLYINVLDQIKSN